MEDIRRFLHTLYGLFEKGTRIRGILGCFLGGLFLNIVIEMCIRDSINTSLTNDMVQVFASAVTVIGALIMMLSISPTLVLVFVFTVPLSMFMTKKITGFTRPLFRKRSAKLGELNGFVEEMISGQKTLRAYSQEENTIKKLDKQNRCV